MNNPTQTAISADADSGSAGTEPWLAGLNLATTLNLAFFRPTNERQRVVVCDVQGFGEDGTGITLETKNDKGEVTETKHAKCYAEVQLLEDGDALRSVRWQVLSKPTVVQLGRAIQEHGPTWKGNLLLEVSASGRGLERRVHLERVTPERIASEAQALAEAETAVADLRASKAAAKKLVEAGAAVPVVPVEPAVEA